MPTRARTPVCLSDKVAFLHRPDAYPGRPHCVRAIETHFSWVFLVGRRAYKLKKPVHQAPMDYRSVANRKRACEREVVLNRRLAPDVYLGVAPLSRSKHGLKLGSGGRVVDWLVVMRRLPAQRLLDHAIARHAVAPSQLSAVIERLARFYAAASPVRMSGRHYLARLRSRTLDTRCELLAPALDLDRELISRVTALQLDYLRARAAEVRARAPRIVDGHGDLRPEHVYLGPPLAIIDCLEFDRDLRTLDPLEEIAFLALECERLGAPELARALDDGFRRAASDPAPQSLTEFYLSQRASNRAKIAAWHLRDPAVVDRARWSMRARSYLSAALRHGEAAQLWHAPERTVRTCADRLDIPAGGA